MSKAIDNKIKSYLKDVKNIVPYKKAFIFGSYLNDNHNVFNSDIDIALFSDKIDNNLREQYQIKCLLAISKYMLDIQPMIYSIKDYNDKTNDFIQKEIIKKGKEVKI